MNKTNLIIGFIFQVLASLIQFDHAWKINHNTIFLQVPPGSKDILSDKKRIATCEIKTYRGAICNALSHSNQSINDFPIRERNPCGIKSDDSKF